MNDQRLGRRSFLKGALVGVPVAWEGRWPLGEVPLGERLYACEEVYGTCNVKKLGAIGDGRSHPLSERYSTLRRAKVDYPVAESLSDEIDWAVIQTAVERCDGVFLPPGTYVLGTNTVRLDGRKQLLGAGMTSVTLLYEGNDVAVWVNSGRGISTSSWAVRNLTIDCQNTGPYALRIGHQLAARPVSANIGLAESLLITGATEAGLHLEASQANEFINVHCSENSGDGCRIAVSNSRNTDTHFYKCNFLKNGKYGFYANQGNVITFSGCLFQDNGWEGLRLEKKLREAGITSANWIFDRCWFHTNNLCRNARYQPLHIFIDSEVDAIWKNIELRHCVFQFRGARRLIKAGQCQLRIWYPYFGSKLGMDTGSPSDSITIWSEKPVTTWDLKGSESKVVFYRTDNADGYSNQIYMNQGGSWFLVTRFSPNGIFTQANIEVGDSSQGLILTSPGGFRYRLTVDDAGNLTTTAV